MRATQDQPKQPSATQRAEIAQKTTWLTSRVGAREGVPVEPKRDRVAREKRAER